MRSSHAIGIFIIAALIGCNSPAEPADPLGAWGGRHVGLLVTSGGAVLEYDCAAGTIDEPLTPDDRGRFRVLGTHTIGQGGPIRQDDEPDPLPAIYSGTIEGDTMTLTVILSETGQSVGQFNLERGAAARIFRCL